MMPKRKPEIEIEKSHLDANGRTFMHLQGMTEFLPDSRVFLANILGPCHSERQRRITVFCLFSNTEILRRFAPQNDSLIWLRLCRAALPFNCFIFNMGFLARGPKPPKKFTEPAKNAGMSKKRRKKESFLPVEKSTTT